MSRRLDEDTRTKLEAEYFLIRRRVGQVLALTTALLGAIAALLFFLGTLRSDAKESARGVINAWLDAEGISQEEIQRVREFAESLSGESALAEFAQLREQVSQFGASTGAVTIENGEFKDENGNWVVVRNRQIRARRLINLGRHVQRPISFVSIASVSFKHHKAMAFDYWVQSQVTGPNEAGEYELEIRLFVGYPSDEAPGLPEGFGGVRVNWLVLPESATRSDGGEAEAPAP